MGTNRAPLSVSVDAAASPILRQPTDCKETEALPAARSPLSTRPSVAEFEFDYYRSLCCCGLLHITTGAKIVGWVQLITFILYLCLPIGSVALANTLLALGADQANFELTNGQQRPTNDVEPSVYDDVSLDYDDHNYTVQQDGVDYKMPDDTGHNGDTDYDSVYLLKLTGTQMTVYFVILIVMVVLLGVLPICVMVFGVHKRKRYLLLPYLVVTACSIILGAFCLNPLAILHTWFCYVVFRCYRHFRWCDRHPEFADCYGDPLLTGPHSTDKLHGNTHV